jgi:hypothetical protein
MQTETKMISRCEQCQFLEIQWHGLQDSSICTVNKNHINGLGGDPKPSWCPKADTMLAYVWEPSTDEA